MSSKLPSWIRPHSGLSVDGDNVFCKPCGKVISSARKYLIDQHCKTPLHQRNCEKRNSNNTSQASIRECLGNQTKKAEEDTFKFDLCKAMVASNIPLNKLNNTVFKSFLEKYCKKSIPDESTLRKNMVEKCYLETFSEVKSLIKNNFCYVVVDETQDVCGRYIANLMIGTLTEISSSRPYLIAVKELEKTNNITITRFIQEGLSNVFLPNAVPVDKVLLLLTDAASYMVKVGIHLKIFYPNLIHCTCLAHGLNRVAEEIRQQFPLVNEFINNMKKVFVKAPLRVQRYREVLPGVPLPPRPVITRWGTWIEAALFYFEHFREITEVMLEFADEAGASVKQAKIILKDSKLSQQLCFINSNYKIVTETIKKLQQQNVLLTESVKLIEHFKETIDKANGPVAKQITKKLSETLTKNEGFTKLTQIAKALDGDFSDDLNNVDPTILSSLKYAPITSVDVERSFSSYKNLLTERRQSFKIDNLERHLIISVIVIIAIIILMNN